MSAITAKASRKMKKYAVLTREPRCFLGSFDFSWEQRKFSELVQIERGGSPRPIDDFITDAPNGLNWIKIGDAPTQGNYITKTAEKIRPEGLSKTREVHPGDLILSNSMSFGKPYIMGIDGCIHDGWLLIRNTYGVFDLTFLCHLLGTPQMLSQYRSLAAGSTVNNLNKELVGNTVVTIPSITEQRVLGDYLEQLDNLITLHQRKCALLFSPFQALISMMFTTSTFSWEQRKLGELVDVCSGRDYKHLSEGTIPVYGTGGYMLSVNDALSYDRDAIGIGRKGTIDRPYILKAPFWTVDTLFYAIPREKVDLNYAFDIFQNIDWKKKDESTGVPSLSKTAINDIDVLAPKHDEQQIIGQFFAAIDNLITLHQRKCISFTGRAGRLISTVNKKRITSSWEQRKLGEIGSVSMCRRIFKEQTSETGDIPFYKIGTFGAEPDAFISRELFEEYKSKYPYPKKGDILISASGSIGRTVEFAGNNEYFQDSNIVWLSHDERLSNSFLKCFYSVVKWAGIEGSTIKRLYNDNILNTVICMPSVPEQEHIGLFFENLDNLITLHQRKPFLMKWRNSDANRNQTNRLVL